MIVYTEILLKKQLKDCRRFPFCKKQRINFVLEVGIAFSTSASEMEFPAF